MGVIVGDGENRGVTIWTNDKEAKDNNIVFAFHGAPFPRYGEFSAESEGAKEIDAKTESKVFMPYTKAWTTVMSQDRLAAEMDKYYQLTKQDLLDAKTIDVVAHSYGPIKALAFLHAIAKDKENAPKILAKVKNLHLYNPLMNLRGNTTDERFNFERRIQALAITCLSCLRGEFRPKLPNIKSSIASLYNNGWSAFDGKTVITHNPNDEQIPYSVNTLQDVQNDLKVLNKNIQHEYDNEEIVYRQYGHFTYDASLVDRFTRYSNSKSEKQLSNYDNPPRPSR